MDWPESRCRDAVPEAGFTEYLPVFRPFGASLRLFKIAPGDFVRTVPVRNDNGYILRQVYTSRQFLKKTGDT
jgi:hypothetical protein